MPTNQPCCKLVIIHGWGGTYIEAAACITELLQFSAFSDRGAFLVPRRQGALLRHLFNDPGTDRCIIALRKLAVSRFLASPPAPPAMRGASGDYTAFTEDRLRQDFPEFGFPLAPAARRQRAACLRQEAEAALGPVLATLDKLLAGFQDNPGADRSEQSVRDRLKAMATDVADDLLPLLETLRAMQETGGDLDTVGSAVFHARRIRLDAERAGTPCVYGRDYRFVFVNYHESFRSLAALAPAELYAADLPVGAFPGLAADIRFLHANGVHTARFEDHHPWRPDQREALEQCLRDGALGMLALSGPAEDTEQPENEQQCAADMVFASRIAGTAADTAGARRLRDAAHGEDFVRDRTDLGTLLTDLIKGGICKVELAQLLLASLDGDDAMTRLDARGWAGLPAAWANDIESTAAGILDSVSQITLSGSGARIITAAAVHAEPGKPKLPTGRAIAFLASAFPDAQYAFYCYGSSLMVARRLDPFDTTLNLGSLMPVIGCAADGGHAGAAVCRPDANPRYPARLLGQGSSLAFHRFSRYLADSLAAAGYPNGGAQDRSARALAQERGSSRRLVIVLATAFSLGLLLLALFRPFRPGPVRESNADFFPQIAVEQDETDGTAPDEEEVAL